MKIAMFVFLVVVIGGFTLFIATQPMLDGGDSGRATRVAEICVQNSFTVPLLAFRQNVGRFPTTEEGLAALVRAPKGAEPRWQGPYIWDTKVPLDPWGHEYRYRFPSTKSKLTYDLWSLGPDGRASEDDIGNWAK